MNCTAVIRFIIFIGADHVLGELPAGCLMDNAMKMRIRTLIPAIIAIIILVGGPFGLGPMCDTDPHEGLICYCCSATGEKCTMISCSGCCGSHAGATTDHWSPEMIPEHVPTITPLKVVYGDQEASQSPETVYLEVPDKPPESL